MQIELAGAYVALEGDENPIAEAALAALCANGGRRTHAGEAELLLISCSLLPETETVDCRTRLQSARRAAAAMATRGRGRIVFLLSAIAGMPMRRHPEFSAESAGLVAGMRAMAMEFGPSVLVNAVGFGLIQDGETISGDESQLSHIPVGRRGALAEALAPVLFLCDPANSYTTGQLLQVDGGWTAGYGRNF